MAGTDYTMQGNETGGQLPPQVAEKPTARRTKTPSRYPLPSERIPFELHFEVIRRFMTATGNGREAVAADAVEGAGLRQQAAQLNTGFMESIGLLTEEERGKFKPTSEAIRFIVTRSAGEERARPILRALIENSWFADAARTLLSSKPAAAADELCADLAIAAGTDLQKKAGSVKVLVDYLVYSGLVRSTEQGLVLGGSAPVTPVMGAPAAVASTPVPLGVPSPVSIPPAGVIQTGGPPPGVMPVGIPPRGSLTIAVGPVPVLGPVGVWRTIQTDDFLVRVRSDLSAIADLEDHLALLKKKLRADEKAATIPPPQEEE